MKKTPSPNDLINSALKRLLTADPWLKPYENIIHHRLQKIAETEQRLTRGKESLADFASGHTYFGLHFEDNQWVFR
jgi:1,4-alpha-glucan branching enzyme